MGTRRFILRQGLLVQAVLVVFVASAALVGPVFSLGKANSSSKKGTAVRLAYAIERTSKALSDRPVGSSEAVAVQAPKKVDREYSVVFFPEHEVGLEELVTGGVPEPLAQRIFRDLAYVDVGQGALIVYAQEGVRLNFTSYWRRFASVDEVLVVSGQGGLRVDLVKTDEGLRVRRSRTDR